MKNPAGPEHELLRQQALVRALTGGGRETLRPWVRENGPSLERGLNAYQANAGASAERALAGSFPTVQSLMGEEDFGQMARAFWRAHPPSRGDLAWLGAALPDFLAASDQLGDEPYLPDSARLDWLLAQAEAAPDADPEPASLGLLAENEPAQLRLLPMPSVQVLESAFPMLAIWEAHRSEAADAFAPVRAALVAGEGSQTIVWRSGWRAMAQALNAEEWRFTAAMLEGQDLARALDAAGDGFDFGAWLAQALQQGWMKGAIRVA